MGGADASEELAAAVVVSTLLRRDMVSLGTEVGLEWSGTGSLAFDSSIFRSVVRFCFDGVAIIGARTLAVVEEVREGEETIEVFVLCWVVEDGCGVSVVGFVLGLRGPDTTLTISITLTFVAWGWSSSL